jgi:hypothetical protein
MPTEPPDSSATSTQLPLAKLKELLTQGAFIRSLLIAGCCLARWRADARTATPAQASVIVNKFDLPMRIL